MKPFHMFGHVQWHSDSKSNPGNSLQKVSAGEAGTACFSTYDDLCNSSYSFTQNDVNGLI